MERYTLTLKHTWIDVEECTEDNIEEPYIAMYTVSTLDEDMKYTKQDIVVNLCDRLIEFMKKGGETNDTDK